MPAAAPALLALGAALLASGAALAGPEQPPPEVMAIEADAVLLDLSEEVTRAGGQARLSYGDAALHAQQIEANRVTGKVTATGDLALVQQGRRLEGERLEYNFRTGEGSLENARVQEQGVVIRGAKVDFSPKQVVARQAYFTTCDSAQPHYILGAETIRLTARQAGARGRPESGRLTLDRAHVIYRGRRLLTLPRYSVSVGQLGEQAASPFPASGFDREDGPYASISYLLGRPGDPSFAGFSYRYTSFRGIRGYLKLQRQVGPAELAAGYVRREASTDRELRPDEFTTGLANVMVNRAPELRATLEDLPLGRRLHLRVELLRGSYSETEHFKADIRARADRSTISGLLTLPPYPVSRGLRFSHALGWRRSNYSPGDQLTIRFLRHSLELARSRDQRLSLSYVTRTGSGATPFLFDQIEVGRELLAELRLRLSRRWSLRVADLYDLERRDTRDMMVSVTRTVHCLDYTLGWRKARGSFFVGINLAPPLPQEQRHDRAGTPAAGH